MGLFQLFIFALAVITSPFLLHLADAAPTGSLPSISVQHYVLCHGTGHFIAFLPGGVGLTPLGPPDGSTANLQITYVAQRGGYVIRRSTDNYEIVAIQQNNGYTLTMASSGHGSVWNRSPADATIPFSLYTTINNVRYYMTASPAGFAMVTENQFSAVPYPFRLFEVVTLQQS